MINAATRKFIGAVEDEWQLYSDNKSDYTIGAPIGFGASSNVYAAQYQPSDAPHPTPCALKVLDLDRLPPHSLRLLQRETQLMSLSKHPNVLRVRGTWMDGHKLYIAMRLMNSGSAQDVMRYGWPGGMEEEVVRCILKQALEGLNYLHINGLIHRDVKAANLLIDDDGTVLLGDLGVAAFLWDTEDTPPAPTHSSIHKRTIITNAPTSPSRHPHSLSHSHPHPHTHQHPHTHTHVHKPRVIGKRKSFVGTPCWMAPEVINGRTYDASADIWSFGITALELTQGHAPRSRLTPHAALLQTVRDEPPRIDPSTTHHYSRAIHDIVAACLDKDPARRPTAAALLQMPFFRGAPRKQFLVGAVLKGLPPLAARQERRHPPSILTHGTMDSWDFSASLSASPTGSVYGHLKRPISALPADGVFEFDNDDDGGRGTAGEGRSSAEAYALRIRGRHPGSAHTPGSSRSHSRAVSQAEDDPSEYASHPAPIAEVELPPPTSESESEPEPEPAPQMLRVPAVPGMSTSPSGSYTSTTSATTATTAPSEAVTPPRSATPPAPSTLWRRLTARFEPDKEKEAGNEREKEKSDGGTVRRRRLGGVLGSRTIAVSSGEFTLSAF
ncbi:kinase-like protein [Amylocystis lapponica]|nr:kinase-like protein [Amylocystis lapponica]